MAYHGNTFNPDTGEIVEYGALSKSSDGPLWQSANTDKIHWLAQGNGNTIHGTDTMFFIIPVTAISKGEKSTYLCITCAHCLEKKSPIAYGGLSEAIGSHMMGMLAPKLPI